MSNDEDDQVLGQNPVDPSLAPSGRRRSTFTPPPAGGSAAASETQPFHDDDELANALAADLWGMPSERVLTDEAPFSDEAFTEPEDVRVEDVPAAFSPPMPAPMPEPAPMPQPTSTPVWDLTPDPLPVAEVPAWSSFPAPDPAQAVDLPEGPPEALPEALPQALPEALPEAPSEAPPAPVRETPVEPSVEPPTDAPAEVLPAPVVSDPELLSLLEQAGLEPGGTLSVIEQLEAQLKAKAIADAPPEWEVPPPSASWSPVPEFDPLVPPTPAPVAEDEIEPEVFSSFAPPPLVEPPPLGVQPVVVPLPPVETDDIVVAEVIEDDLGQSTTEAPPFSFEDLLSGSGADEVHPETEQNVPVSAEGFFVEPAPFSASEGVPLDTDSISVIDQAYEEEIDDDVDDTDRVTALISPPSGPISTVRVPEDEVVLLEKDEVRHRVFSIEPSGLEPTPLDQRIGRSARLFWLWFASNSTIVSLGLGASIFALGMSLRQSVVAVLAGVALSFIPLGLSTLAGKRSGQPTMVVSRASFGVLGNVVPSILALITRVFWGAVLLWLLASGLTVVLVGAELAGPLSESAVLVISLGAAFGLAVLVAFAGYPLIARIQLISSVISAALIVGLIVLTIGYVDLPTALTTPDGSWILTVTGAVLVFSVLGLVWATSGADLARYQRPYSSGAASMLWATFGATLPAFTLIAYGALLAASDKGIASGFVLSPLDTLALMLPTWYPVPLIAATALSLLSGVVITLYSGGFALQAIGVRLRRQWSTLIAAVLLGLVALVITFAVAGGIYELLRDLATTLAVPTAAWAGIFAAEMMIRNRRFESASLTSRGGVYADVRWGNFIGLFVISAIGLGLTSATVTWLGWQGYLFTLLGVPLDSELAGTDLGVLVALGLGILLPIVIGIPAIRRQEETRV